MVKYRIVKLRFEIEIDSVDWIIVNLYSKLIAYIVKYYKSFNRRGITSYPIGLSKLLSLIEIKQDNKLIQIGIIPELCKDKSLYNNILDIEFGNNGHELRLVSRALEDLVQYVGGIL